ncbi:DUF3037 domain-containing protein [Anditalea andensis]|uniref:DUF3037 domain-containing protein n=1 Tax=Anditalea andensis TaxID=1048983 RepID=A0A074KP55_9BACT|nr:DUF3037 domain-containing protein [Anditalea andensis]KEO71716.1 hypothetical protein EL17_21255 [Anditalea andensis]
MQEKHLYEYAIIRVVPRVEREEFINVGVIVCAGKSNYIKCKIGLNKQKLASLDPEADLEILEAHLDAFSKICSSPDRGGPISKNDPAGRFRWLTAVRSSMIQTSRPHTGLTGDLEGTLDRLYQENVL